MEFPDVGGRCGTADCKRLDFLPLTCECGSKFCPEHFKIHVQTCETTRSRVVAEPSRIADVFQCSHPDCKRTGVVSFRCEKCGGNFCVAHRHTVECSLDPVKAQQFRNKNLEVRRQFENAKLLVNKEIDKNIARAKSKGKNTQKIQLMRLKLKAVGLKSIPVEDRIYFNVKHPKDDKTIAVYVSKTWSIGRAIDAISEELKIVNRNNRMNALKLKLFKTEGGQLVSHVMSEKMEDILKANVIADSEELQIEYVTDSCVNINEIVKAE